jgi:glucosamine-6-phosphate deaminase
MKFITTDSYKELSHIAANIMGAQITLKPNSVIGLATGSTPLGLYRELGERCQKGDLDFSEVITVNLDEYAGLKGDHEQSYRYFMQKNLFDHINVKPENTYVPNGCSADPAQEGKEYDDRIEAFGGIDMQLLGIGMDGHIGFNEPADHFVKATHLVDLHESTIEANSRFFNSADEVPKQAVTMGMGSIMGAKKILMIVNGKAKKDILMDALYGPITPQNQASILQLHPDVTVIYTEE